MFNLYYNIYNSTEEKILIQSSFKPLEGLPYWSGIWSDFNGNFQIADLNTDNCKFPLFSSSVGVNGSVGGGAA